MADLQCAATFLISCPGEVERDSEVPDDAGGLTLRGRVQARELGRVLRDAHLSMIYCSSMARAVQTAEIVAAEVGVPVRVRDNLRESSAREELQGLLDLHRGETVLVVSLPGAITLVVPQLADNVPGDFAKARALGDCDVVVLAGDADGWVLRSWAGEEERWDGHRRSSA